VDNDGANLRFGAAPSLPEEYNQAVDGLPIGPNVGSCGTAAYRKELVVVSDIAVDPLWVEGRDQALAAGLRACWSLPIFSTRGDVLGTFAMYYDAPRTPEKEDIELIERATHIAGIAIERKEGEEALQRSEERYRNLVNTAQDVIYTLGLDASLTSLNPAFETVTGWKREDWSGKNFAPIVHADDLAIAVDAFKRVLAGETVSYELRIKKVRGDYLVGEFTSTPLIERGVQIGVLGVARDVTERKKAEETIRDLAYHDALTGLPNRALFEDRLGVALAQAHRSQQMLAVMFLDLDRFKVVNDTLGHGGGDKLLKGVAADLQTILREGDTVARVGGDEFTLLLPGIAKQEDAIDIAQRILDVLRGARLIDGQEFAVTTSIGITVYPQDGADTDTLLRNADTAMYRAKERGRDNFQLYTPAMNAGVRQRLSLENDLRHALERNELRVYYQPIAETQTGRVVATEALLRWQHPERGIVAPDEFIPFAEETGLIVPIGEWVLREAMLQNRAWQDAGHRAMRVSVNLSARQLQQEDMVSIVARLLRETGLAPQHLQLEITESAVMKNVELIIAMLHQIRRLGVGISLDDFGTGYSSLSYLKRFPIDSVKIDRSFVRDIATDPSDAAIVTTVIVMARNLNLKVIAEGVETPEQLEFLQKRGCDEYQGYLISRPVEPAEIAGLLEPPRRTRAKITRLKSA
jgi:diguanylate cyclase (GGDEF)-like protein/PAS domain S-box-containing protein